MRGFSPISVAALAVFADATAINYRKRDTPLAISLTRTGNTEIRLSVTNQGDKTFNLLTKGTFLDEINPVEKVTVYSAEGSKRIPFEGIKLQLLTSGLKAEAFLSLKPDETHEVTVQTAALHSLEKGGDFEVFAQGLLPYADDGSTELAGTFSYESEKLLLKGVDGTVAASIHKAIRKRTTVESNCSGSKLNAIRTALSNSARLASAAASAASAGTKLDTYFKSTSTSTKNTVRARLEAVARDSGGSGGATSTNCNDPYGACSSNVLAYTAPADNFIAYCNIFFAELPALTSTCHGQDQATTVLHEETHAPGVYSPGTDDFAYGFAAASRLSASRALLNADSYALYANAIYLNC
ncbi:neutral protease 2-like protein [Dendryphion nanum]|uniref:Neutral protease 2 n=1 Tax=Dendryphion nanum TaxID=256645 RepID=A0A9P9E627_9PLEO|nr:neutral protease 2-like protein [Dendryphion nanum]